MKKELIQELFEKFEQVSHEIQGIKCWSARELQVILGYAKWENFFKTIEKAKTACEKAGEKVTDHFPDIRKMVGLAKGAQREVADIKYSINITHNTSIGATLSHQLTVAII